MVTSYPHTRTRRVLLALAQGSTRLRGIQERHAAPVPGRTLILRDPAYRPTDFLAADNTREWITEPGPDGRVRSRLLVRDRPVAREASESKGSSGQVSGAGNAHMADCRARTVVMFQVQAVPGGRAQSNRASQLSGVRTLERSAESVRRSRQLSRCGSGTTQTNVLLLQRRGEWEKGQRAFRVGIILWMLVVIAGFMHLHQIATSPLY